MCLPAYIQELYIGSGGNDIHINTSARALPGGSFAGFAQGVSEGQLRFKLKGMKLTPFEDSSVQFDEYSHGAVQLEWRPDIDFVDVSSLLKPMEYIVEGHIQVESLSLLCSMETLEHITSIPTTMGHLVLYREWTKERIARAKRGENPLLPTHFICFP